jgi:hypothetical protein
MKYSHRSGFAQPSPWVMAQSSPTHPLLHVHMRVAKSHTPFPEQIAPGVAAEVGQVSNRHCAGTGEPAGVEF